MKLLRIGEAGRERPAVRNPDGAVVDVSSVAADFDADFFDTKGIGTLQRALRAGAFPAVDLHEERVGPPIARPGKIVCVGLNYQEHIREARLDEPAEPVLFLKAPNTICGPNDDLLIPPAGSKTDWEVELGVVIGSPARYLASERAARDVIAGFCVSNDVSERSFQLERGGQWTKGKSCETFNPLGPWLVTPDEIPHVGALHLWCSVNGTTYQSALAAQMIRDVYYLVWYVSQFMVLDPGDLINTGTPSGVGLGLDPQRYLVPGDVLSAGIDGLGSQRQVCTRALTEVAIDDPVRG